MPQYDTDPAILEDRCYMMAMHLAFMEGDEEVWPMLYDEDLIAIREDIRSILLEEFPDIEGPRIAELMDEGLRDAWFPLERV